MHHEKWGHFHLAVMQYYDYKVAGKIQAADMVDRHGFFVGNHHYNLKTEIEFLIKQL